ncbi:hypothetical protein FHS29_003943 [Saccharothrix tamanrassetensis]|uniref:Uncharacterized protein n=1 Tax=Saccharothrix tamanrassetensis TaxID=1051531 RepID=A0A841CJV5_9PSEU|nr:hypothetical protein [Saccharothrix tamanrassetensis]
MTAARMTVLPGTGDAAMPTCCTTRASPTAPNHVPRSWFGADNAVLCSAYRAWGWTTVGDIRPGPDSPTYHAMLHDLPLDVSDHARGKSGLDHRGTGEPQDGHPATSWIEGIGDQGRFFSKAVTYAFIR